MGERGPWCKEHRGGENMVKKEAQRKKTIESIKKRETWGCAGLSTKDGEERRDRGGTHGEEGIYRY